MDEDECAELVAALAPHAIDQACYFYYDSSAKSGGGETLYQGEVADVDVLAGEGEYYLTPTYWWPEGKSWTVFTDPDYTFTLVGGPQALIDSILKSEHLEAVAVELTTRITPNSDDINIKDDQTETT